ncbi:MAG TPA: LssY C-terminal domain-containing protein [Bryobacteraceae bacterium]|nr:LssY C-terminal domain-containing protein [Bryobacteraceae bacterium]
MRFAVLSLFSALPLAAVVIPAGTELNIRLTDRIASETTTAHTAIHAVLVSPVAVKDAMALPLGATLTGEVAKASAANFDGGAQQHATMLLTFSQIGLGAYKTKLAAVVSGLDNSRETVEADGTIHGIDGSETFTSRIDQGVDKLKANDRFAALAGIIQAAKQVLKIQPANPNIDYDPGVEMTLKLTAPLDWRGATAGPEAKLVPMPDPDALADLVAREPWRTMAQSPARPSDVTNVMLLATEQEIQNAFAKAGWSSSARLSTESKLETARALIEDRGYKEGPMSVLYLDGQAPAFMFQKGNNTYAARHHLRVFRRPDTFAGKPVWVVSSTHDTGIDFSERDRTFIHRIDSNIDNERAKVVDDLLLGGAVRSLALVDRDLPANLANATGDAIQTDGRMAVLLLQ